MLIAALLCPQLVEAQGLGPVFDSGQSDSSLFSSVLNLPADQTNLSGQISLPSPALTRQVNVLPGGQLSLIPNQAIQIDTFNNGSTLSGTLVDGSPLSLPISAFSDSVLTVTQAVPEPTSIIPLIATLGGFLARRANFASFRPTLTRIFEKQLGPTTKLP